MKRLLVLGITTLSVLCSACSPTQGEAPVSPAALPPADDSQQLATDEAADTLPAGLYFTTFEPDENDPSAGITRLWTVDAAGQPRPLREIGSGRVRDFQLSADGAQALYTLQDDIWLLDLVTGDVRNLTGTPEQRERQAQWWPEQPGTVICGTIPVDEPGLWQSGSYGYLTFVSIDGAYQTTDDFLYAAPLPLGEQMLYERIAVTAGGEPFLPDGELVLRSAADDARPSVIAPPHGLLRVESLSASPDESTVGLAVQMQDAKAETPQAAILLLDRVTNSYQMLDRYEPLAVEGSLLHSAPRWQPGGDLLAYYKLASPVENSGVWVVDGEGPHQTTSPNAQMWGSGPVIFSPDGRWIAAYLPGGEPGVVDTVTWRTLSWDVEPQVIDIGWIDGSLDE